MPSSKPEIKPETKPETLIRLRQFLSERIWRLYFLGAAITVVSMFLLPPPYSAWAFLALIGLSVVVVVANQSSVREPRAAASTAGVSAVSDTPPRRYHIVSAVLRQRYARHTPLLTAVAILFMILSAIAFIVTPRVVYPPALPTEAVIFALIGGLFLGLAIYLARGSVQLPPLMMPTDQPITPSRTAWLPVIFGGLMLLVLAEINGQVIDPPLWQDVSTRVQLVLLWGGVILIAWGLGGAPLPRLPKVDRREVLVVGVIVGAALFVRLWGLETTLRVLPDEMNFVDGARGAEDSQNFPILFPMSGISPYTWLFPLLQADMAHLFGRNLTGLRAASAVLGAANVFALYLLARTLFDRKTALIAAAILVTFPPFLHYSRLALLQPGDAFFGTLSLAFVARGLKYNRRSDWALAGVSLGMTQYFFEAGRLLFPVLVIAWLGLMAITLRGGLRRHWRGVAALIVGAVMVGAPVYYTIFAHGRPLTGRMDDSGLNAAYWQEFFQDGVSQGELNQLVGRISQSCLFHVFFPEESSIYYGGTEPMVLRPLTPLFLLGVFYALWRWRSPGFVALLWAAGAAFAVGLLIRQNMLTTRFFVSMPAMALLIGIGVRYVPPLLFPHSEQGERRFAFTRERLVRYALPVVVVGVVSAVHLYYYFGPHLETFNREHRIHLTFRDIWDVVLRAAELPYRTQTLVIADPPPNTTQMRNFLGYLQYVDRFPVESYEPGTITTEFLLDLPRDRNYAFFVQPTEMEAFDPIYRVFRTAQLPRYSTTYILPDEEFVLVYVPLLSEEAGNRRN